MTSSSLDAHALIATLAGPGRQVEITIEGLLELWPPAPDRLARAFVAAGADVDDWDAIELVVRMGERLATLCWHRDLFAGDGDWTLLDAYRDLRSDDREGLIIVDDELRPRLPLLELAADLAQSIRGRRLRVELVDSSRIPGLSACVRCTTRGGVVLLDAGLDDDRLAESFAHELAHVLDPERLADEVWREAFAEDLTPRLLEAQPRTVDETAPLVEASLEATCGFRRSVPASNSLEDLLEWAIAEVCPDWTIQIELIAAHRAPGPGVNAPAEASGSTRPPGEGRPYGTFLRSPAVPAPGPGALGRA